MKEPGTFHQEALVRQHELYHGHLSPITLTGLAGVLYLSGVDALDQRSNEAYAEALADMAPLIDEIRFSGALAALYMDDYDASQEGGSAGADDVTQMGIPIEVMATLPAYYAPLPAPLDLFANPHKKFTGSRILSLWFAGQLLDSALFRCVAVMDRLAIMIWCLSGQQLRRSRGDVRYPAFREETVKTLAGRLPDALASRMADLATHPLLRFVLDARNDFTHSRRLPSELHGHYRIAYDVMGAVDQITVKQAMDKNTHIAMLLAVYNEVLQPGVDLTRAFVRDLKPKASTD